MTSQRLISMWGLNYGWVPTTDDIIVRDMFENELGAFALLIFHGTRSPIETLVFVVFDKMSEKFVFEFYYNKDNEYNAAENLENLAKIAGMRRNWDEEH